tara:strand:- start:8050 stop:8745 length:696 start_codon:yes stop_codon:yes gene_type:complete
MEFLQILYESVILIVTFDYELYQIILLSLKTSGFATIIASFFGIISAYLLTIYHFRLRKIVIVTFSSLMGIPPVVVGLIVYFIFTSNGPLGIFKILYTPMAMIIAQVIIVYPIITTLSREIFAQFYYQHKDQMRSFNFSNLATIYTIIKNTYYILFSIILSGFGRAISEVGAVMIVGGNIEHYTRIMTTAISLETSMGNLEKALSLGIILILLTVFINGFVYSYNNKINNN